MSKIRYVPLGGSMSSIEKDKFCKKNNRIQSTNALSESPEKKNPTFQNLGMMSEHKNYLVWECTDLAEANRWEHPGNPRTPSQNREAVQPTNAQKNEVKKSPKNDPFLDQYLLAICEGVRGFRGCSDRRSSAKSVHSQTK